MSEFKIGDRVSINNRYHPEWKIGTVDVLYSSGNVGVVEDNLGAGSFAPSELRVIEPATSDPVNHPAHYTQFPVEVIDITEHLSFNLGNVVKYACRAGRKDGADPIEDLRKMLWYGQRELERLSKDA